MGWFAWGGILYAGVRARHRSWVVFGLVYAALIIGGTWITGVAEDGSAIENAGVSAWLLAWFATFVHALVIRRDYLDRMHVLTHPSLDGADDAVFRRQIARELAKEDPERAIAAGVGRPDLSEAFDGDLVDINHASAAALAGLPGFDDRVAKRAVAIREEINGFESVDDLALFLDIAPDDLEQLRERVVCLPL